MDLFCSVRRISEKDRIFVAQQIHVDDEWIQEKVQNMIHNAFEEDSDIRHLVQELVSEYVIKEDALKQVAATQEEYVG